MSSLPFRGLPEEPTCPTCQSAGWLPNPFSDTPGDFLPCPSCHCDWRWTVADEPPVLRPYYDPAQN
jgi:hypothetical protein